MMNSRKPRAISFFRMAQASLLQASRGVDPMEHGRDVQAVSYSERALNRNFRGASGPTVFAPQNTKEEAPDMIAVKVGRG